MKSILKVESVGAIISVYPEGHAKAGESIVDNAGKPNSYKSVVFSVASDFDANGREIMNLTVKPRSRNIWKNTNEVLFNQIKPNMLIHADIVTATVEEYQVGERTVNTFTGVQFANETLAQAASVYGRVLVAQTTITKPTAVAEESYNEDLK